MANPLKLLLREPLVHFLVLGAAIFVAYTLVSRPPGDEPGKIVITQSRIASLVENFALTRQRPPTDDELRGLVQDQVREEVYYREALALGMDKDDTIIRRRLWQKMEFVTDNVVARAQPTDDELDAYLQANPNLFRLPRSFTFSQVFLDPERHGAHLASDAAGLLSQLNQTGDRADISILGDPFMLERRFEALPTDEVAKLFGETFATTLGGLPIGQWQGPFKSAYGVHLVFVSERREARVPALSEVREAVRREWDSAMRKEASETFYGELLKRYTVTIDRPEPAEPKRNVAAAK